MNLVRREEAFVFERDLKFETFRFDTSFAFVVENRLVRCSMLRTGISVAVFVGFVELGSGSQTGREQWNQPDVTYDSRSGTLTLIGSLECDQKFRNLEESPNQLRYL